MQNSIYNFALKSGEINRIVLCEMCDQMPEDMRKRFIEAILGIVNIDDAVASIPKEVTEHDGTVRTMTSFNYFFGTVEYDYPENVTRYFKDEEKATKFAETGDSGCYSDWEYKQTDTYQYPATHTFTRHSNCPVDDWFRLHDNK